jgi:hypothetical protein
VLTSTGIEADGVLRQRVWHKRLLESLIRSRQKVAFVSSEITEVKEAALLEEPRLQAGWRPACGQPVEVPGFRLKYRD